MYKLIFKMSILNTLHTIILFGTLFIILYLMLGIVFSDIEVYLSILIVFLTFFMIPKSDILKVMKSYDAYEINRYNNQKLYSMLLQLSKNAHLQRLPKLYYIPSNELNAFSIGDKNENAIAISKGLFDLLSLDELYGVMAHEISHIKNNDIWIMQYSSIFLSIIFIISVFTSLLLLYLVLFFPVTFTNGIYSILIMLIFLPFLAVFVHFTISRIREFKADLDAVEITKDTRFLLRGLQKLLSLEYKYQFFTNYKGDNTIFNKLFTTHPSLKDRVIRLQKLYNEQILHQPIFDVY